jgi:hypothetical protein
MLVTVFVSERDEATGSRRKLHNEELHNSYSSLNITKMIKPRKMRWSGNVACLWNIACLREMKNAYNLFVGKPERLRRRWEGYIRMDFS